MANIEKTVLIDRFKMGELFEFFSKKAKYFSFESYHPWKIDLEEIQKLRKTQKI